MEDSKLLKRQHVEMFNNSVLDAKRVAKISALQGTKCLAAMSETGETDKQYWTDLLAIFRLNSSKEIVRYKGANYASQILWRCLAFHSSTVNRRKQASTGKPLTGKMI